jgi:hypothetical protein
MGINNEQSRETCYIGHKGHRNEDNKPKTQNTEN